MWNEILDRETARTELLTLASDRPHLSDDGATLLIKCARCYGKGHTVLQSKEHTQKRAQCPVCNGSGLVIGAAGRRLLEMLAAVENPRPCPESTLTSIEEWNEADRIATAEKKAARRLKRIRDLAIERFNLDTRTYLAAVAEGRQAEQPSMETYLAQAEAEIDRDIAEGPGKRAAAEAAQEARKAAYAAQTAARETATPFVIANRLDRPGPEIMAVDDSPED